MSQPAHSAALSVLSCKISTSRPLLCMMIAFCAGSMAIVRQPHRLPVKSPSAHTPAQAHSISTSANAPEERRVAGRVGGKLLWRRAHLPRAARVRENRIWVSPSMARPYSMLPGASSGQIETGWPMALSRWGVVTAPSCGMPRRNAVCHAVTGPEPRCLPHPVWVPPHS